MADASILLDTLAAANVIQLAGPGRYQFHDLIRDYAAALCEEHDEPADRTAAYVRLLAYYASTVDAVADRLYADWARVPLSSTLDGPSRSDLVTAADQLAWLDAEHANLVAVVRQSEYGGCEQLVCSIVSGLYGYLNTHRHDRDWRNAGRDGQP